MLPPTNTLRCGYSLAPHQAKAMPKITSNKASNETSGAFKDLAQMTDSVQGMANCTKPNKASKPKS
jgi:hypothetical protein